MEANAMKSSKYYIDYIYDNTIGVNFYHQLVRRSDEAILYANPDLNRVYVYCWSSGIDRNDVVTL
jgi:hypothetical protein